MAGVIKKSTGLAGLAVEPKAREKLMRMYNNILNSLRKLPEDYTYRKHTEQLILDRANIVKHCINVKDIEDTIGCGQIEELLEQATDEWELSRKMLEWKPWEPLVEKEPPNQWTWPPNN